MRNSNLQFATRIVAFTLLVSLGLLAIGTRATLRSLVEDLIQSPLGTTEAD